jgi:hypothetical protein
MMAFCIACILVRGILAGGVQETTMRRLLIGQRGILALVALTTPQNPVPLPEKHDPVFPAYRAPEVERKFSPRSPQKKKFHDPHAYRKHRYAVPPPKRWK